MSEVLEILGALEALAASTISRGGLADDARTEFQAVLAAADAALEDGDMLTWVACDDRLHRMIGSCSNRRLEREIGLHLDQIFRAMRVLVRMKGAPISEAAASNRLLVEAINQRDADRAADLARTRRGVELSALKSLFENSGVSHL